MRQTLFFIILFLCPGLSTSGQEVISPTSFLKYVPTSEGESVINVTEFPGASGYLFSFVKYTPYNLTNTSYFPSAHLVKTDNSGNVSASFSVSADTTARMVFVGLYALVKDHEVLFMVSSDSAGSYFSTRHLNMLVYHLDSSNLSLTSVDTIQILPPNSSVLIFDEVQSATGSIYGSISYTLSSNDHYTMLFKVSRSGNNDLQWQTRTITNQLIPQLNDSGFNYGINVRLNAAQDSLELFMISEDVMSFPHFRLLTVDTSLGGAEHFDLAVADFEYAPGHILDEDVLENGIRISNTQLILGPQFFEGQDMKAALLRYDLQTQDYDKGLVLPDSPFSFARKTYAPLKSMDLSAGSIYCVVFDYTDIFNLFFDNVSNHIYVGKTDPSLNQWHWYKYIGNPQTYHFPYKILATSDGGCIITSAIYDFVNNPNLEHDLYVIKLDANGQVTSVSNLSKGDDKAIVYPIPAQDVVYIRSEGKEADQVMLFDLSGKLILQTKLQPGGSHISLLGIAAGTYFYRLLFKDGTAQAGKLIKQ